MEVYIFSQSKTNKDKVVVRTLGPTPTRLSYMDKYVEGVAYDKQQNSFTFHKAKRSEFEHFLTN